jgi:hypothetical protein
VKKRSGAARGRREPTEKAAAQPQEQRRLWEALEAGFGAWKDEDHPELNDPGGTDGWVRKLREEDDRRLEEILSRPDPEAPH